MTSSSSDAGQGPIARIPTWGSMWSTRLLLALGAVFSAKYLFWRLVEPVPGAAWVALEVFGWMLLGVECCVAAIHWHEFSFRHPNPLDRSAQADRDQNWWAAAPPSIGILLPTYDEPWAVLERTLVGALAQSYANCRVWILDDGARDWLEQKAVSWNVGYIRRQRRENFKAGNINNALTVLAAQGVLPDYVALLDADFIARRTFLQRTLALMTDPAVAIVQTPQRYYNPDPFQRIFGVRNWPEDNRAWFDIDEPSLDAYGGALCCGTACLIRVSALAQIGGIPTWSLTEDTLCSRVLYEYGYRTVYLSECLAVGLAADGLHEWLAQRTRWHFGGLQNHLHWTPAIGAWRILKHWVGLFRSTIIAVRDVGWRLALIIYWHVGFWPIGASPGQAAAHVLPLVALSFAWAWKSGGRNNPVLTSCEQALKRPIWLVVPLQVALSRKRPTFSVTSKVLKRHRSRIHWGVLGMLLLPAVILAAGMVHALVDSQSAVRSSAWLWPNVLLSVGLLMESVVAAAPAIEGLQRRQDDRYPTAEQVGLEHGSRHVQATCRDLSVGGALLELPKGAEPPVSARLIVADVGAVTVRLVRKAGSSMAAYRFEGESNRRALIRKIYCSERYVPLPNVWSVSQSLAVVLGWLMRGTRSHSR
jgi:cellulose synthase (UDP-forming)